MREMVKLVAQALHAKLVNDSDAYAYAQGDYPFLTLDGDFDCEEIVQIVIAAMREPTEAMVAAAEGCVYDDSTPGIANVWRTMIDAG